MLNQVHLKIAPQLKELHLNFVSEGQFCTSKTNLKIPGLETIDDFYDSILILENSNIITATAHCS